MADLDDFFAKKDRKKPKGKKFTTTEEIAKKLEEKKVEKPKKEKITYQSAITGQVGEEESEKTRDEEEEWKEFEEEKKDYTGLKIQNLSLQEEVEEESEPTDVDGVMEENEQGEMVRRKKGPWKAIESDSTDSSQENVPAVAPSVPVVTSHPAKYVSPHLRNQGFSPAPLRMQRSKVAAPDIMNADNFPTLSAATNETPSSWGRKKQEGGFEEVRNSKSHSNRGDSRESKSLEIGNKFGALQSENS